MRGRLPVKRVLHMVNDWRRVVWQRDGNNIDLPERFLKLMLAEIDVRGGNHTLLLARANTLKRAVYALFARPHFYEYERLALARHDVNLAARAAPVRRQDDVTALLQVSGGNLL